jgi:hypothetical protein
MEAAGTPLGGGALKLEATHIRQVPLPSLSHEDCLRLATLGRQLSQGIPSAQRQIDIFILAASFPGSHEHYLRDMARHIETHLEAARAARQRTIHDI